MPFNSGYRGKRANDTQGTVGPQSQYLQKTYPKPYITGYTVSGSDDTALDPAGGQTVLINGGNFSTGVSAILDGTQIGSVTLVNSNQISFTAPAKSSGSYTLIVYNSSNDAAAILVPGLIYSGIPTWTTSAGSIGTVYETQAINTSVVATSDSALTYAVTSGTIPTGATFYANGVMAGTAPADSGSTTYTFAVTATDAELQDTTRTFTLTVNTDVVTWSNPSNGASIVLDASEYSTILSATSAAGYNVSYAANALPDGLTLSGNTISGTATTEGTTTTLLTATAATSNRSATNTITWLVNFGDSYWTYVATLLNAAPITSPFINDASTNNLALTITGETKPNNFNPYTPGYYSNYFDGTGDYLTLAGNSAFSVGSGDYTVEAWIYPTAVGNNKFLFAFGQNTGSLSIGIGVSTANKLCVFRAGIAFDFESTANIVANVWTHIAVTKLNGTTTIWINGQSSGVFTTSYTYVDASTTVTSIGTRPALTNEYFVGYMSNVRLVKGQSLYNSAFTPNTSSLTTTSQGATAANVSLLTCQSNRLIDTSTNNFAITRNGDTRVSAFIPYTPNSSYSAYGSTYFDGEGDYVAAPNDQSAFGFGTGNFTIECWLFNQSTTSYVFFDTRKQNEARPNMGLASSGTAFNFSVGTTTVLTSTVTFPLNSWVHLAAVRDNGVLKLYVNGQAAGSVSFTTDLGSTGSWCAGTAGDARGNGSYDYGPGFIADMRVVKGTAVYTSAFTPPSQPLSAVSGTSLLTFQTNQPISNNTFLDNSTSNFSFTRNGNITQGTFSPYGENWSNYFDKNGDYLVSTANFGSSDFTIEMWVCPNDTTLVQNSQIVMLSQYTGGPAGRWGIDIKPSSQYSFFANGLSGTVLIAGGTVSVGTWAHLAVTRSGASFRFFVNGTLIGTSTATGSMPASSVPLWIGAIDIGGTASSFFGGHISNLRLVSGAALYTSNFTPSTTPLSPIEKTSLLTCQSPRIVDNSPNNLAITRNGDVSVQKFGPFAGTTLPAPAYSVYFDGTGDYLTIPGNAVFNLYTGDWTIEYWFYHSADKLTTQISQGEYNWRIQQDGSNIAIVTQAGTRITATSISLYAWHHLALVSYNGTITLYIDGVSKGTTTVYPGNDSGSIIYIGKNPATTAWDFNGYLSDIRIVKGTAVYTSAFTPPTAPLTAISGTSLLTCQSATFVDNSTNNFTITVNGDSRPTRYNPFTAAYSTKQSYTPSVFGGSMYFDGTGDYLSSTSSAAIETGPFTIEAWVYLNSVGTTKMIVDNGYWQIGNNGGYRLFITTGNVLRLSASNGTYNTFPDVMTGTTALSAGQWYHIAVVRNSSNVINFYVNGMVAATPVTYTASLNLGSGQTLKIGSSIADGGVYDTFNGYISDVRIIPGTALYNSNFPPPNAPLTSIKNTTLLVNGTNAVVYDSSEMINFETIGDAKISTTNVKFSGTTSTYLDGSGDYVLTKLDSLYDMWRGNLTIEGWFYFNSVANAPHLWNIGESATARCTLYVSSSVLKFFTTVNSPGDRITSSTTLTTGTWYHVALTKSGTTFTLWLNGVSQGTSTTTVYPYAYPESVCIGYQNFGGAAGDYFNGYVSGFRITRGVARYTSAFTPPSVPSSTS